MDGDEDLIYVFDINSWTIYFSLDLTHSNRRPKFIFHQNITEVDIPDLKIWGLFERIVEDVLAFTDNIRL